MSTSISRQDNRQGVNVPWPLLLVLAVLPLCIVRAFILSKLWGWYVAPFFQIRPLPLVYAFGFALIISFISAASSNKPSETPGIHIAVSLLSPFLILLLGWIGTFFL